MILWSERMLALTGEAEYADVIERIAFNSLLAGISLDGRRVLLHEPAAPGARPALSRCGGRATPAQHPSPRRPPSDERLRERYLSCFCCPPNIARTLARFHELAASVSADGAATCTCTAAASSTSRSTTGGRLALRVEDSD